MILLLLLLILLCSLMIHLQLDPDGLDHHSTKTKTKTKQAPRHYLFPAGTVRYGTGYRLHVRTFLAVRCGEVQPPYRWMWLPLLLLYSLLLLLRPSLLPKFGTGYADADADADADTRP
jgi:hypothetical protein